MASYGAPPAGDAALPSDPRNKLERRTGLPFAVHEQLTSNEVEAMASVRRNYNRARLFGGLTGSSFAYLYLVTKKRKMMSLPSIATCLAGSIVGSVLFSPLGVVFSSKEIMKVEDPKHLAGVLASAKDMQRNRHPASTGPGEGGRGASSKDPAAETMSSSSLPPAPPPPRRGLGRASNKGPQTNEWGDEIGGQEMAYSGDYASAPAASTSMPWQGSMSEAPPEGQNQSRWAQLRGQRGVQECSWEKIRQQNARDTYNRQASSGQGRPDQEAFSQGNEGPVRNATPGRPASGELADPTFGKGSSQSRIQAQREYEKSFERERKGIDG